MALIIHTPVQTCLFAAVTMHLKPACAACLCTNQLLRLSRAPPPPLRTPAGARPILRFTQCIVLSPASSLSSTQGLAQRVRVQHATHPQGAAKAHYRPPPVLQPEHPAARRVVLRVQVSLPSVENQQTIECADYRLL
jgi:hypothetical protein